MLTSALYACCSSMKMPGAALTYKMRSDADELLRLRSIGPHPSQKVHAVNANAVRGGRNNPCSSVRCFFSLQGSSATVLF